MSSVKTGEGWLTEHRANVPYEEWFTRPLFSREHVSDMLLLADKGFNNHDRNGGNHISPYDSGKVDIGLDGLEVRLIQGIDEEMFAKVLRRTIRATNGIDPREPEENTDWTEMLRGGLQTALETQVLVFEITGASRILTHQLVRTRKAAYHQQSQRATWYGDRPNQRWPEAVLRHPGVRTVWERALLASWDAYKAACDAGVSYQDARYILPEGTTNYILCEYPVREFINMFAYRGCSMFQWEMVGAAREMRRVLLEAHPFLEPYVKISCEKGALCPRCLGSGYVWADGVAADPDEAKLWYRMSEQDRGQRFNVELFQCESCRGLGSTERKCTFQGWENVETQCDFPWARQDNRVFLPAPRNRIGG